MATAINTENNITKGIKLAQNKYYKAALDLFEESHYMERNYVAMSYYALSLAAVKKDFKNAMLICSKAAKEDFSNPVIYLNAARIYLLQGRKDLAVKALRKGLAIDSTNKALVKEITGLGTRRKPFIGFLSRDNIINTLVGSVTYKLGRH